MYNTVIFLKCFIKAFILECFFNKISQTGSYPSVSPNKLQKILNTNKQVQKSEIKL